eukprot:scaffold16014_cov586-Ochromonas_danica.AAC.1
MRRGPATKLGEVREASLVVVVSIPKTSPQRHRGNSNEMDGDDGDARGSLPEGKIVAISERGGTKDSRPLSRGRIDATAHT